VFKLLLLLLFIVLLAVAAFCIYMALRAVRQARMKWTVRLRDSEQHPITTIYLVRGERQEYFCSVSQLDPDYEQKVFNASAAAGDEIVQRNIINKGLAR
jgi:hypothetical protein